MAFAFSVNDYDIFTYLGTLYTLDLFMRIKNNATRKAVKTII